MPHKKLLVVCPDNQRSAVDPSLLNLSAEAGFDKVFVKTSDTVMCAVTNRIFGQSQFINYLLNESDANAVHFSRVCDKGASDKGVDDTKKGQISSNISWVLRH